MNVALSKQVEIMFAGLNRRRADSFPPPGALAEVLARFVTSTQASEIVQASPEVLSNFATAAIEMWLRALHSFLMSTSLTNVSPIWASVSGYYSSHYAIRGFAHMFGVFHLYKKKRIVYLEKNNSRYVCRIEKKNATGREHKFYWKYVSEFVDDPFFYPNQENLSRSDGAHRTKANYWDHVDRFSTFCPLEREVLLRRIERISNIEFSDVPIPDANRFPDIENIQIVAYHRIVKFREYLDNILKSKNRFWNVHRKPPWCPDTLTFSVAEPVYTKLYLR